MGTVKIRLPKSVIIFLTVIVIIIATIVGLNMARTVTYRDELDSDEEIYSAIINNVVKYKNKIHFKTYEDPSELDYDRIFSDVVKKNTYVGSQVYAFSYRYKIDRDGYYDVTVTMKDPLPHRTLLTKWRVKQIASVVKGMDDYDAVKAVHDYLILSNEYTITMSSAFNTLYVGRSCCNGYAYAFYAIMKELGIPATCEFGGSHAWNKVKVDGQWYNIDLTWDDLGGREVGYDYFLKCDADWEEHHHGGATATSSLPVKGKSAMENYRMFPNYRLITIIIAVIIGAILIFVIIKLYKRHRINELIKIQETHEAKAKIKVIDNDDIEFDSPDLKRVELLNDSVKNNKDSQNQYNQNTYRQNPINQMPVQAPQPSIYGQQPVQPAQAPQPSIYGQQPVQPAQTPQPSIYGQQPVQPAQTPQPSIYGQQPAQTPQPLIYGQQPVQPAQPPQSSIYGQQPVQPEQTPQPLLYGQQQANIDNKNIQP